MSENQTERLAPGVMGDVRPEGSAPNGAEGAADRDAPGSATGHREAGGRVAEARSTRPGTGGNGRRRTPRRTRQELRGLLVQAGTEILWEEGLAAGAEHVTFKRVFERLEETAGIRITHASVIGRIWQNQEEFQTEVLTRVAQLDLPDVDAEIYSALSGLEELDRSTPEQRWRTAMEICRVGGLATFTSMVESRVWPRWMGIWALAAVDAGSPRKQPIVDALLRAETAATDYYETRYAAAMQGLGLRMREPFTVRQFAVTIDAYAQGCVVRASVDPVTSTSIDRPTGPGGASQPWTLFAVGLAALVDEFIEVDPDWTAEG